MFSLIKKFEGCWILSLPAIGRYKVEFVIAPTGYKCKPHVHPDVSIEHVPLLIRDVVFYRKKADELIGRNYYASFRDTFSAFTVPAKAVHYFEVCSGPFIFLNIEKWNIKPTSLTENFKYAEK